MPRREFRPGWGQPEQRGGHLFASDRAHMNSFDLWIMHVLNSFANRSWAFDATMAQLCMNQLLTGGIFMAMFWWAWFEHGEETLEKRGALVSILMVSAFSLLVARSPA